mmetsp:Transcript_12878/g.36663  ORF Transcript_12878/g.36663 Transcript_12878/m.36663 type:complete len:278 (-) Transcript_12878:309-1142(-)
MMITTSMTVQRSCFTAQKMELIRIRSSVKVRITRRMRAMRMTRSTRPVRSRKRFCSMLSAARLSSKSSSVTELMTSTRSKMFQTLSCETKKSPRSAATRSSSSARKRSMKATRRALSAAGGSMLTLCDMYWSSTPMKAEFMRITPKKTRSKQGLFTSRKSLESGCGLFWYTAVVALSDIFCKGLVSPLITEISDKVLPTAFVLCLWNPAALELLSSGGNSSKLLSSEMHASTVSSKRTLRFPETSFSILEMTGGSAHLCGNEDVIGTPCRLVLLTTP